MAVVPNLWEVGGFQAGERDAMRKKLNFNVEFGWNNTFQVYLIIFSVNIHLNASFR
jgi:hypothetical protein